MGLAKGSSKILLKVSSDKRGLEEERVEGAFCSSFIPSKSELFEPDFEPNKSSPSNIESEKFEDDAVFAGAAAAGFEEVVVEGSERKLKGLSLEAATGAAGFAGAGAAVGVADFEVVEAKGDSSSSFPNKGFETFTGFAGSAGFEGAGAADFEDGKAGSSSSSKGDLNAGFVG